MKSQQTVSEALQNQMAAIEAAIAILEKSRNELTSIIDPESKNWADVSKFAHVASAARQLSEAC